MLNYKVLPLFAILVLMVLPVSNVYATISGSNITLDSTSGGNTLTLIGFNDFFGTPTGAVATPNGYFTAYIFSDVQNDKSIFFTSSTDGVTYTAPLNVTSTLDGFGYAINNLSIFEDSGIVDILWIEQDGAPPTPADIRHTRSTNGGTSFGSVNIAVSTATGFGNAVSSWYQVEGNIILVLWEDGSSGDLFYTRSSNGGTSFSTPVVVNDGTGGGISPDGSFRNLEMKTNSGATTVWIMYTATDTTNFDFDVYTQYSNDSGATWTSPINLSAVQGTSAGTNFQNHLFVSGTNVTAVFSGFGGGAPPQTYLSLARSTNNGVTFNAQQDIELGIVCNWGATDLSHVVAQDKTNLSTIHAICRGDGNVDMMKSKSTDSGATWSTFTSIASDPTDAVTTPVIVQADNGLVTYFWQGTDVFVQNYYRTSTNGGAELNPQEIITETINAIISRVNVGVSGFDVFVTGIQSGTLVGWYESFFVDIVPPVITLVGSSPVNVAQFGVYNELGATCLDDIDGQIDANVEISGQPVNTNNVATFILDYDCADSSSNFAITVKRTINVLADTIPPVISVLQTEPIVLFNGQIFTPEDFVQCVDNVDGIIPLSPDSSIDTLDSGTQFQNYFCQDVLGNSANITVEFLIKQVAGSGGSSISSAGDSSAGGQSSASLSLPPPISTPTITTQPQTVQDFEQLIEASDTFQRFFDLFSFIGDNRLDADTGVIVQDSGLDASVDSRVAELRDDFGTTTTQPAENPIAEFFRNLFSFFG